MALKELEFNKGIQEISKHAFKIFFSRYPAKQNELIASIDI